LIETVILRVNCSCYIYKLDSEKKPKKMKKKLGIERVQACTR